MTFNAGQVVTAEALNALASDIQMTDCSSGKVGSGTIIGTESISIQAGERIFAMWVGRVGFDTSLRTVIVNLSTSSGSLAVSGNGRQIWAGAAQFAQCVNAALITGASAGTITVTATANASGNSYYQGSLILAAFPPA